MSMDEIETLQQAAAEQSRDGAKPADYPEESEV
jgi:hypothetical protein